VFDARHKLQHLRSNVDNNDISLAANPLEQHASTELTKFSNTKKQLQMYNFSYHLEMLLYILYQQTQKLFNCHCTLLL